MEIRWNAVGDDGADRMNHVFTWQIVGLGDFGLTSRLLVVLLEHQMVAFFSQLNSRSGMDGVVDALVQRMEASQHLAVGGVDDGIHLEARNITLPY